MLTFGGKICPEEKGRKKLTYTCTHENIIAIQN